MRRGYAAPRPRSLFAFADLASFEPAGLVAESGAVTLVGDLSQSIDQSVTFVRVESRISGQQPRAELHHPR